MDYMSIYATFNADGECLYVGQTTRHPVSRWREHLRSSKWALDATRWEILPDLTESGATRRLNPRFSAECNASSAILESQNLEPVDPAMAKVLKLETRLASLQASYDHFRANVASRLSGTEAWIEHLDQQDTRLRVEIQAVQEAVERPHRSEAHSYVEPDIPASFD